MKPDTIELQNFLQSNDALMLDNQIAIGVIHIPRGGQSLTGPSNSSECKKSIVQIVNKDNLCLARAVVICKAYALFKEGKMTYGQYKYIQNSRKK